MPLLKSNSIGYIISWDDGGVRGVLVLRGFSAGCGTCAEEGGACCDETISSTTSATSESMSDP